MCGIWGYILKHRENLSEDLKTKLYSSFQKLKHRGPDRSDFIEFDLMVPFFLGFHRLAIMDRTSNGDQPFVCEWEGRTIYTMCNGELYNHAELVEKYQFKMQSHCDCEVIPHIYKNYGIETLINDIKSGEFSFIILDINQEEKSLTLHVGHDPTGVRPLYYAEDENGMAFSSELGGLVQIVDQSKINIFPPGSYMTAMLSDDGTVSEKIVQYYSFDEIAPFREPEGVNVFAEEYLGPICSQV
jgi:asparagine synthase (glutamine-hydrolysing)